MADPGALPPLLSLPVGVNVTPVIRDVAPQLAALLVAHAVPGLALRLALAEARFARPLRRRHHRALGLLLLLLLLLPASAAALVLRERRARKNEREQDRERRQYTASFHGR